MHDANSSFRASIVGAVIGWIQVGATNLGFHWSLASAGTREVQEWMNMLTAFFACVCTFLAMFWALRRWIRWARGQQAAPGDSQPPTGRA